MCELEELLLKYNVKGVTIDSRHVSPGDLFVAMQGQNLDGNLFIEQALKSGAVLVFTESHDSIKLNQPLSNKVLHVNNVVRALAQSAAIIYKSSPKYTIAVTGTNGKTSVVSYLRQLIELLGEEVVTLGSLGLEYYGGKELSIDTSNYNINTPDLPTMRKVLDKLGKLNIDYLAFEASSHGIAQKRICDIVVQLAAFTSFSLDHLDYHKTMKDYLDAKLKLFTENLSPTGYAVINADMDCFEYVNLYLKERNINVISVGERGDLKIINIDSSIDWQIIDFIYNEQKYRINTKILGSFQASNMLIAAVLLHKAGFEFERIIEKLPLIHAADGRLQKVNSNCNKHVFVDYAHTPDALSKSLEELRKLIKNNAKLIVLFGCGGDRDSSKRQIMGFIAHELADLVIVTDDNPRTEDASSIRNEILLTATSAVEIGNREEAIFHAIANMRDDDILLIAGKGHEKYQICGTEKIIMDDVEIAKRALKNKL